MVFKVLLLLLSTPVCWGLGLFDSAGIPAVTVARQLGAETYSINVQILAVMTVLTLLPAVLLAMTSFTRIIIVMSIMRHALGMPQTPSNQILIGLALFLTFFIMTPIFNKIENTAITPFLSEKISLSDAFAQGVEPIKEFMLAQTREADLEMFANLEARPDFVLDQDTLNTMPLSILAPAFLVSELKTAFQIGFLIFIPFLIIDVVVASVLMAMGMMMLSPLIISLPFKIMLFVLIDGWNLITGTLGSSFGGIG